MHEHLCYEAYLTKYSVIYEIVSRPNYRGFKGCYSAVVCNPHRMCPECCKNLSAKASQVLWVKYLHFSRESKPGKYFSHKDTMDVLLIISQCNNARNIKVRFFCDYYVWFAWGPWNAFLQHSFRLFNLWLLIWRNIERKLESW